MKALKKRVIRIHFIRGDKLIRNNNYLINTIVIYVIILLFKQLLKGIYRTRIQLSYFNIYKSTSNSN
jgi:hypothetical protein